MTFAFEDLVRKGTGVLAASGIANPRRDANLLLRLAADLSPEQALTGPRAIDQNAAQTFERYVTRRGRGEPVSRIRGRREFWSLDFEITPATLDPRADSEVLVAAVIQVLAGRGLTAPRILDLGTGSGCLLISLLAEFPQAVGVGVDVSPTAAAIALRNAATNGVDRRADFVVSNWHAAIGAQFDVVISNPPYIPTSAIQSLDPDVRVFDPHLALDGGRDGLSCYRAIAGTLPNLLSEGGFTAVEIGMGQADAVAAIFGGAGLTETKIWPDLAGIPRCLTVEKG